jgi:hypothetical protein
MKIAGNRLFGSLVRVQKSLLSVAKSLGGNALEGRLFYKYKNQGKGNTESLYNSSIADLVK